MRIPKTKARVGREEPFLCADHPKRLAITRMTDYGIEVDRCWVCRIKALLELTPGDWLLESQLLRWINHYQALGQ